jgi:uncharacterized protein YndB with AHSA1/START domain
MPAFRDAAVSAAPPEEVWKLLYDPARYPEWWSGIAAVEVEEPGEDGPDRFSYYPEGGGSDPPLLQLLETSRDDRRIVVSCTTYDFRFEWALESVEDGGATRIDVLVDVPEAQAASFDALRDAISRSLARLADLAPRASGRRPSGGAPARARP